MAEGDVWSLFLVFYVHPVDLEKCTMTCIHHSGFTVPKFLCALPIHPSLALGPRPHKAFSSFTVSIVLPFPQGHTVDLYNLCPFQFGVFHFVTCI